MILKLKPALKNYVWGGTKLISEYNKTSDEPRLAESWELSLNGYRKRRCRLTCCDSIGNCRYRYDK